MARVYQTGLEMGYCPFDVAAAGVINTVTTAGSWSTYSIKGTTNANPDVTSLPASYSELYLGARFYADGVHGENVVYGLRDSGTTHVYLTFDTAATTFKAFHGAGGLLGTASGTYANNAWHYVESRITIDNATGIWQLKVDGTQVLNLAAQDTRNGAAATANQMSFAGDASSYLDDIYVNDTTGAQNNAFSGDIRISAYIPNAAGDVTGLTATSGSNYATVDERPPNDATDYVYDSGTSNYDLYNIPDTSGITSVQAATLWLRAQKSDAGAKNIAHKIKSAATEDTGADIALSTSWTYYGKVYDVDPTDSNAWTASKINALQIGAKAR